MDIEHSTSSTTVYLLGYMSVNDGNATTILAQETSVDTPALNPLECPPDLIFSQYTIDTPCVTSQVYTGSARNGQIVPLRIFTFNYRMLNTRYIMPSSNATIDPIPNNTVVAHIQSRYFWYLPTIKTCTTTVDGRCTVLSASASAWVPSSGANGAYVPLAPYVLVDTVINPIANGSYTISPDIDDVIEMVRIYYSNVGYNIGNIGIGPQNLTNGCIEMATVATSVPLPSLRRALSPTTAPFPSVATLPFLTRNKTRVRARGVMTTGIPQISDVTTTGYGRYPILSMNIEDSYSPDSSANRLFAYIQTVAGVHVGSAVIAQQTQYHCPLWNDTQCNTDLTFTGYNFTLEIDQSLYPDPASSYRAFAIGAYDPFTYGRVHLVFVPGAGPYTIEQALALATVPPKELYYFVYAPRMNAVYPNGTVRTNLTIYWNTTKADFEVYPICPNDPVFNPTSLTFASLSAYYQWASVRFTVSTIVSSSMTAGLFGGVEFTTVDPPIYGGSNPNLTLPPTTGPVCSAVYDCITGTTSVMVAGETRCLDGDLTAVCRYDSDTNDSAIVFTGKGCTCVV